MVKTFLKLSKYTLLL